MRKLRLHRLRFAAALLAAVAGTSAAAGRCDSASHRQFDFWLGEWEVRTPNGKLAGVNRIEREYDGCVLHERYASERGYKGESLNAFDPGRNVWHQTWVDNQGTLLLLEGETRDASGRPTRHRITWTPNVDGSVRQHWESTDDNARWTTAFDGLYRRK